jgi:hypothetical protein
LSDHLVGNSLEVRGLGLSFGGSLSDLLGLDGSDSGSNLGLGGGTSSGSFLLGLGLGLSFGSSLGDFVVLNLKSGGLGSSSFLGGLLFGSSGFLSLTLLLLSEVLGVKSLLVVSSLLSSGGGGLLLSLSDFLVGDELSSSSFGFDVSIGLSFSSSLGCFGFGKSIGFSFGVGLSLIGNGLGDSSGLLGSDLIGELLSSSSLGGSINSAIDFNDGSSLVPRIFSSDFSNTSFLNHPGEDGHGRMISNN